MPLENTTTADLTAVNTKLDAIDDFVDTEVGAIKAKTDNLPTDPADASDISAAITAVRGADSDTLKTLSDALDAIAVTLAAIQAKTDLIS